MKRLLVYVAMPVAAASIAVGAQDVSRPLGHRFNVVEATIPEMQRAMESGRTSSRELVTEYLLRIAQYEDLLNAIIAMNPNALEEADQRDRERARGAVRGPLHGIPIAIKDNVHTTDMPTTGGALAFRGYTPPYEATLVANLHQAGAVILAKTVLTELANWVSGGPVLMPANYSAVGGFGYNPYDPRPDPRAGSNDGRPALLTGGSSSGIGTAANLWAANVGTETFGSILSPANATMLVGIKPTVGRVSRYGVIPITADQDIAGPLARTVVDAAIMLGAMEGRDDPNDPSMAACGQVPGNDYTRFLRLAGLRGARIGIPRAFYYDPITFPGGTAAAGGLTADRQAAMNEAIQIMRNEGAVIVDPANIPSIVDGTPANNLGLRGVCFGSTQGKGSDSTCSVAVKFGFKRDFNAWLASLGAGAPVKTLTELRNFNLANIPQNALKYGQTRLDISDEMNLTTDLARYQADRALDLFLTATHGIDEVMAVNKLDALVFPGVAGFDVAARPGYPTVIVPFAMVANPGFPPEFGALPSPFGVSFTSTGCNEPRLLEIAYAFEQATKRRVPPTSTP